MHWGNEPGAAPRSTSRRRHWYCWHRRLGPHSKIRHSIRYFEDIKAGDNYSFPEQYTVTEEEIIEMGERWDPQPFHTDPDAAKKSIFGD